MDRQALRRPVLAAALLTASGAAVAASQAAAPAGLVGAWQRLPAAPIAAPDVRISVWTGREMLVFGRAHATPTTSTDVAAAYDPGTRTWRRLAPPAGPPGTYQGTYSAVWTGRQMLVWGPLTAEAYTPATDSWRRLPPAPTVSHHAGVVVAWTGRELIGWGGGCCGDSFTDGAAYDPATNRWRRLPRAPLAGGGSPVGDWTGRELVVVAGAGAAAYDPRANRWRAIAAPPAARGGASAVWDGREVLLVGGGSSPATRLPATGFAYDPAADRWRRLAAMPSGRMGATAVWDGRRLLVLGGETGRAGAPTLAMRALAYEPAANRWTRLPRGPLSGRLDPAAVRAGRAVIVWGGDARFGEGPLADGAAFGSAS
jgi:N-acetylneuraminic acid mutarotase